MENLEGEDEFDGLNVESIQRQRCGFGVDLHVVENKGEWCVEMGERRRKRKKKKREIVKVVVVFNIVRFVMKEE